MANSIRVVVSKTVQERQFEPVSITMEETVELEPNDCSPKRRNQMLQMVAENLQKQVEKALMDRLELDDPMYLRRS